VRWCCGGGCLFWLGVGVNSTDDPDKKEFALVRTDTLEELIDLYKWGSRDDPRLLVPVHTYEQARRELLDVLKSH
jgi:hypothetical protein